MGDSVLYVHHASGEKVWESNRSAFTLDRRRPSGFKFLRAKRRNQTFCFLCPASDSISILKDKIVDAANQHCGDDAANRISSDLLRITKPDNTVLNNEDELSKKLKNNDIVHVVLKISENEWEPVELEATPMETEDPAASSLLVDVLVPRLSVMTP